MNEFIINSNIAYELGEGCSNVDIRYDIKYFDQLKNCKRVFGGLKISELPYTTANDFRNLSFPELTEITGYLFIDHVAGLDSLYQIFPNLTVIRGDVLLHQSVITITNNPQLIDVRLQSLSFIGRGKISIENNPKLCYANRIDWNLLFPNGISYHNHLFIQNNNNECTTCVDGTNGCWNTNSFLKKCNDANKFCNMNGEVCNEECLGGCSNKNKSLCAACKHFMTQNCIGLKCEMVCVKQKAVYDKVLFKNRYIISEKLCHDMNGIPLDEKCVKECPNEKSHNFNENNGICIYSNSSFKYCNAIIINSTAELFNETIPMNCTHISKVFIRNIDRDVGKSLEEIFLRLLRIFGKIADIRMCLVIESNSAILSLHFFQNLAKIREACKEPLESHPFSIIIRNNQNLQNIFPQKVSSMKGQVILESNPSLCIDNIESWENIYSESNAFIQNDSQQACEVPIVEFTVLTSDDSALVLINKLKKEVYYKLWFYEKNYFEKIKGIVLRNESLEIQNLTPNRTYEIYISTKKSEFDDVEFKTVPKTFKIRPFKKYIEFKHEHENSTTENSIEIEWIDLNEVDKNNGVFYLIEISGIKAASKADRMFKGKYTYKCSINIKDPKDQIGYDKYYLESKLNLAEDNQTFITETTYYNITDLLPLHCYKIDISLCKRGNVPRCSQPESKVFQTKDNPKIIVLSLAQKIASFLIPTIVITFYVIYRLRYNFNKLKRQQALLANPETPIDEIIRTEYANCENFNLAGLIQLRDLKFEIKAEAIEKCGRIGGGQFGDVYEGIWTNAQEVQIKVAIKTVKNAGDDNYKKFIEEALNLKSIQTYHIVKAYGCVLIRVPWIIMEFMEHKDLRTFLINNKPTLNEDNEDSIVISDGYGRPEDLFESAKDSGNSMRPIFDMAIEIADGMAYLEHKKLVHRDLACRNCMMSSDLTIKIGDFGMTLNLGESYYLRGNFDDAVPVRWMSPESLAGVFSTKSDVWSFGVVLWEIINFGDIPFGQFENQTVVQLIKAGVNLLKLDKSSLKCHEKILNIMEMCFHQEPTSRISFVQIVDELYENITDQNKFKSVSFFHNQYEGCS